MLKKILNRIKTINTRWSTKKFIGYDLQGNMYFEEPMIKRGINFPRRSVTYEDGRNHISEYDPNSIPVQWQAWMRHTRPDPPTIQELQNEVERQIQTQENIKKLAEKRIEEEANRIPAVHVINQGAVESWSSKR
jgi:NADH dehydrogenase [ubiquinone] 1 alpha subcomplex assembly factor 2